MLPKIGDMMRCKRGASAAEYGLLIALFCTLLVGGATLLGNAISAPFSQYATQLSP